MANKRYPDAAAALEGILFDGMQICAGGFGPPTPVNRRQHTTEP